MSNLDDLRSSFEYNDEDEENEPQEEYEAEAIDDDEEVVEVRRQSPLRLIILILLVLALLCVLCFFLLPRLPFEIPGISPPRVGDIPPVQTTAQPTDEGLTPGEGTSEVPPSTGEPQEANGEATGEPLPPPGTTEPLPPGATVEPTGEPTGETSGMEPTGEPTGETADMESMGESNGETPGMESTGEPTGETPGMESTGEPTGEPSGAETTDEATGETPGMEPTGEPTGESPGAEPTGEPTGEAPVSCDGNMPPIADANGPYNAMQGKGQAVVIFDGSGSGDPDGTIDTYSWEFGDGTPTEEGQSVTHGYKNNGTYQATLTVTDNCGATATDTADVTVVGPTPPSQQEDADSEESNEESSQKSSVSVAAAIQSASNAGTVGFCYRVEYGDTLFGISQEFDVPIPDLAFLNDINADAYVFEGQGMFIPTGQLREGPNVYIAQPYDTLDSIAYECGLAPGTVADANGMSLDEGLQPDQAVVIPPWTY
ncbi:MAG: LysM peptidoglycan-binding domain-containing protein [Anaerolineae bacterium]|nr:LysM peptidoglycan-binding domain-containing protein [Anaerolineae bacterium]